MTGVEGGEELFGERDRVGGVVREQAVDDVRVIER